MTTIAHRPAGRRHSRATPLRLTALACLTATACQSNRPVPPLSGDEVRLDLPLVQQDELYACGLASISALAQYWGVAIPEEERVTLARIAAERQGLSGGELRATLEGLGLEVFVFHGTLDRTATGLYTSIDAQRPLLVMLSPDGTAHHYCLVLGYDDPRDTLILLDPRRGEVLVPVAAFDRDWARCDRFTLLACPTAAGESGQLAHAVPETETTTKVNP